MKPFCQQLTGLLQLIFLFQMIFAFVMFVSMLIHKDELSSKNTSSQEQLFLQITLISSCSLVVTISFIIHLIVQKSYTVDLVGSFRVLQVGASFKVAMLSWVINVILMLLQIIAVLFCKSSSGFAPWELTLVYYALYIIQQSFQIKCLYKLEVRSVIIREGPNWHRFRRAMFILLALFNAFNWLVSLSDVDSVSDLNKECMDKLLTSSVFRIVHTVGRASTLAFRIESTLLFLKYFNEDRESLEDFTCSGLVVRPTAISHTEIGKGRWFSGFIATCFCGLAIASFVWTSHENEKKYILATTSSFLTSLTITIVCIRLQCSGSRNRISPGPVNNGANVDDAKCFENVSVYVSGAKFHHIKLLLFYSITAVTYHLVLTMHLTTEGLNNESLFRIIRESCKSFGCIFLGLFGMWMCHVRRRIRTWRAIHMMLWMIATMFFLDMAEECANFGNDEYMWVIYIFPLAIDFKMYLFVHTWSDLMTAKNQYLFECENLLTHRHDCADSYTLIGSDSPSTRVHSTTESQG